MFKILRVLIALVAYIYSFINLFLHYPALSPRRVYETHALETRENVHIVLSTRGSSKSNVAAELKTNLCPYVAQNIA